MVTQKFGRNNKKQTGGFAFTPLLIPLLASAGGTLIGKIYDTVRDKFGGKGYKIHHKTIKQKKQYLH